jgi:DNA uptake protein ComE-like DNA-binding protein
MKDRDQEQQGPADHPQGVALAITLMVLVVLSVVVAALAVRVAQVRQRQQYIMDYQKARYALDSAIKYAFAVLPEKKFTLVQRNDAPDFSDLFWLNRDQYLRYVDAWAAGAEPEQLKKYLKKPQEEESKERPQEKEQSLFGQLLSKLMGQNDQKNADSNDLESTEPNQPVYVDPNQVIVPGPYGPAWPNVIEPIKLKIGECEVTIAVEDENAKMPLSWLVTNNMEANKQAKVALQTFAEWMKVDKETVGALISQLEELSKHKTFNLSYSTILLPADPKSSSNQPSQQPPPPPQPARRSVARRRTAAPQPAQQQQVQQQKIRPEVAHAADFAKLFHSSLLDVEPLAVPLPEMAVEDESPMKYLALWGSQRVNINTAPRQVLEAAFTFGGKPEEIADAIILARKENPLKSVADLQSRLFVYRDSIERAAPYIDTESKFFLIQATSRCGNAKVSAVATVIKEGKQMERLMILYGR